MLKPCGLEHLKGIPKVLMPLVVWVCRAGWVHIGDRVNEVPHRSEDHVQAVGEKLRRYHLGDGIVSRVSRDDICILFCDAADCHQRAAVLSERWNRARPKEREDVPGSCGGRDGETYRVRASRDRPSKQRCA